MMQEDYEKKYQEISDPEILSKIVNCYGPKIIGEENNIKLLFCACLSKDLPKKNRLSIIITSQSSSGKSNLVNNVLEPFKEDVLDFTDYTPAYLQRSGFDMNGKIFKMEQMERTNQDKQITLGNLKFSLSEGKMKMGLVDKNDKGKNEPRTLEVNGIPVFISTSTNYKIDPETINRTFLMQVDETEEQTKKIISHIAEDYSTLIINDKWKKKLEELQSYSKTYKEFAHQIRDITIPFMDRLIDVIPTSNVTIRRDLPKILNLACVIAFIHFPFRTKIRNNDGEHFIQDQWGNSEKNYTYTIIVEPSDFKEALEIGKQTIKQTINKLNQSSMKIHESLVRLYAEDDEGISIKKLSKESGFSPNRVRELAEQLLNTGYASREKSSREYLYSPSEKKFEDIPIQQINFSKEDLDEWIKGQLGENNEGFTVVNPKTENS